ncbi:EF-hand [Xylaria sp. CBS 124048]|nr:EF-hand [Xylaria sp. CBS 124048]
MKENVGGTWKLALWWVRSVQPPPRRKAGGAAAKAKNDHPEDDEPQSKLAKEHNISAREEHEIKEAFSLFSESMDGEPEGVIPTKDVKRAMVALGLPPTKPELKEFLSIMDPDDDGHATYEPFLAICALKMHSRRGGKGPDPSEVDEAFRLFTGAGAVSNNDGSGAGSGGDVLTLAHLKRIAMTLKQDVDEALLRDMILEANGGAGVGRGVSRSEFEEVMRRAGAWK